MSRKRFADRIPQQRAGKGLPAGPERRPASHGQPFGSAHWMRRVLESTREAVAAFDLEQRCIYANTEAGRIWGAPPSALGGRALDTLVEGLSPELPRFVDDHATICGESRLQRSDGGTLPVEFRLDPMVEDGAVIGTVLTAFDVSERREESRARALRERQQAAVAHLGQLALLDPELQDLLEAAADLVKDTLETDSSAILELLPDGRSIHLRAVGGMRLEGPARSVVVGLDGGPAGYALRQGRPVISPDLAAEARYRVDSGLLEQGAVSCVTVVIAGDERPFGVLDAWHRSPRHFTEQDVHVLEAFANLLTLVIRRRRMQEALRQSELQLHQTQKMEAIGQLAGGVAHDFNNLLTAMGGYCEVMLTGPPVVNPWQEYVEEIREAVEHAAALTRQLLTFSRRQATTPRVIDLNQALSRLQNMLCRLIGEVVRVELDLAPGLPCIRVDPGQIEQVVVNLAINARDAMPHGGTLHIQTSIAPPAPDGVDRIVLAVRDTGCGMDAETVSRIFEPFFTTKEPGRGTGLGLAVVYGIVRQAGGAIEVESAPNAGTCCRIYWPATDAPAPIPVAEDGAPADLEGTETVLLVEDDDRVRRVVRHVLERKGYRVLTATHGDNALDVCRHFAGRIHLLLTDIVMPGMSGPEVAARVLALCPDAKVIFMSGYADDTMARYNVAVDEANFLSKPFRAQTLARKVRQVLRLPSPRSARVRTVTPPLTEPGPGSR